MKTRQILTVVMISLSGIAAMLPDVKNSSAEVSATELLDEMQEGMYKIDADELTEILIQRDPAYMLIDLRSPAEFEAFSLPGAMNIPFDSLFDEDWIAYIDQDLRQNIFYANGSVLASEALALTRQKGFKNNFALQGGLNGWFDILMHTERPSNTEEEGAFLLYQKRMAAKQHFTGGSGMAPANEPRKDLLPIPIRKKSKVQGGCS